MHVSITTADPFFVQRTKDHVTGFNSGDSTASVHFSLPQVPVGGHRRH